VSSLIGQWAEKLIIKLEVIGDMDFFL